MSKSYQIYAIGDIHVPYHEPKYISKIVKEAKKDNVQNFVFMGDVVDFYALSRFQKDPTKLFTLSVEIGEAKKLLCQFRKAFPNARMYYCEGNHEDRLRKFIWAKCPELIYNTLSIQQLLNLDELKIKYIADRNGFKLGNFRFLHGFCVRKNPGWTALEHVLRLGENIVIGHTHRLAMIIHTIGNKQIIGIETGCLTKTEKHDWLESPSPNWATGYVAIRHMFANDIELRPLS